jgi:hypothetical protein
VQEKKFLHPRTRIVFISSATESVDLPLPGVQEKRAVTDCNRERTWILYTDDSRHVLGLCSWQLQRMLEHEKRKGHWANTERDGGIGKTWLTISQNGGASQGNCARNSLGMCGSFYPTGYCCFSWHWNKTADNERAYTDNHLYLLLINQKTAMRDVQEAERLVKCSYLWYWFNYLKFYVLNSKLV